MTAIYYSYNSLCDQIVPLLYVECWDGWNVHNVLTHMASN